MRVALSPFALLVALSMIAMASPAFAAAEASCPLMKGDKGDTGLTGATGTCTCSITAPPDCTGTGILHYTGASGWTCDAPLPVCNFSYIFKDTCTHNNGSYELCDPVNVPTTLSSCHLVINYTTSTTHCSEVRINLFVDGTPVYTSAWLGVGISTGNIDTGISVGSGTHTLSYEGEGYVNGCNNGRLTSWGGSLNSP
jgi:hypothetical protein